MKKLSIILILTIATQFYVFSQYITEIISYQPAPGQFINTTTWGSPASAESIIGGVTGHLSLGAFGGNVAFKFSQPIENDPDNPYGIDFTIMGNALLDWAEPGIVYVMKDENSNGIADDIWYELAGSDHYFSSTNRDYSITYFNPNLPEAADVLWNDNLGKSGYIFKNNYYFQPYYPLYENFPEIPQDNYSLSGTRIELVIDSVSNVNTKIHKRGFGYADSEMRGVAPYTIPDNPYTNEIENSGGDAFDIDWAIDSDGNYKKLDKIDFVKVVTGANNQAGVFGEIATEITGAVDVEPQTNISGILDMIVIKELPIKIEPGIFPLESYIFHKGHLADSQDIVWTTDNENAYIDDNNNLHVEDFGKIEITASVANNPEINSTIFTFVKNPFGVEKEKNSNFECYPNPTKGVLYFKTENNSKITITDIRGKTEFFENRNRGKQRIDLSNLKSGVYILKVETESEIFVKKIYKL